MNGVLDWEAEDDDFYENNPKTFNNDGEDDEEAKG